MNPSKPVLVVYYSLTGNTERVAKDLARRLDADVENIHDKRHRRGMLGGFFAALDAWRQVPAAIDTPRYDPSQYRIVLIGTPVWLGQMTPAVRAYLQRESSGFKAVGFFMTSGNTEIASVAPSMQRLTQRAAVAAMGLRILELEDSSTYERKIDAFVRQVRDSAVPRAEEPERESAHVAPHCRPELAADIAGE
jgi:multimeric flavodoxin WrbA